MGAGACPSFPKSPFPQDNLQGIRREARPGPALPPRPEEEGPGAFLQPVHPNSQKEGQGEQDKATENEIKAAGSGNKGCGCGRGPQGRKDGALGVQQQLQDGRSRGKSALKELGELPGQLGRLCSNGKDLWFSKN